MPGPVRTSHLTILRRALIAYTRGALAVNDGLTAATRAIQRVPDRDIEGGYRVRHPDPARNQKAYRKYWGVPGSDHGTTAGVVVERMLRDALRRSEYLGPSTREDLSPLELLHGIERLASDLEVVHRPELLKLSQHLHGLGPVGGGHAREIQDLIGRAESVDAHLPGGLRATAPGLLHRLAEAAYQAGAIHDRAIPQLVLGPPDSVQPKAEPDVSSRRFGQLLAGDKSRAERLTRVLIRHHLTRDVDFNRAIAETQSELDGRVPGFDGDEAVLCGVRTLLDLDRSAEAAEVYRHELASTDNDVWFCATASVVRTLMVTESQESLVISALERAAAMDIREAVTGGPEVGWLCQLHLPGGAIPAELVAYWAAGRAPDFVGEWSMLETAELLVWALRRQGRHATALEFARDSLRAAPRHSLMPADQRRWGELDRIVEGRQSPAQDAPDVDRALTQLYGALLHRPGQLRLRTVRDLDNLVQVLRRT